MDKMEVVSTLFTFVLSFAFVIALAYLTTKLVVMTNISKFKTKNLKIIEGISLGPQKSLQLVKVADKAVLISISKDNISKIETLSMDDIVYDEETDKSSYKTFDGIFKKAVDKEKTNLDDINTKNKTNNK